MRLRVVRRSVGLGCVALGGVLIAPPSILAGEKPQWYAAAGIENQQISVKHSDDPFAYDFDYGPRSSGYSVRGGLRVLKHVGVEAGIQRIQDVELAKPLSLSAPGLVGQYAFDAQLERIVVVGMFPFAKIWEGYVKGGVGSYRFDGHQALTDSMGVQLVTLPINERRTNVPIAFGVSAAVGPSWHIVLELSSISVAKSIFGLSGDESASLGGWSIGAEYRFARRSSERDAGQ